MTSPHHIFTWLLARLEANRPFTESEAWGLYRIFALAEAIGWTFLIIGIAINRYHLPGSAYAIPIAGQIHGLIFLAYFAMTLTTYGSLQWSRSRFIISLLAGVPPYGTLLFELWGSYQRRNRLSRQHFCSILLARLRQNTLAAQN